VKTVSEKVVRHLLA